MTQYASTPKEALNKIQRNYGKVEQGFFYVQIHPTKHIMMRFSGNFVMGDSEKVSKSHCTLVDGVWIMYYEDMQLYIKEGVKFAE